MTGPLRKHIELTGRARTRPGWFGRQILQVEVRTIWHSASPPPPGRPAAEWRKTIQELTGDQRTDWRDATWADVQELGALTGSLHG